MSGQRLIVLLSLIVLFVLGVFVVNKTIRINSKEGDSAGNPGTIRGVVSTLLPSGKVIAVKKEDGEEVLVSLTEASTITDELGESLFYSDVEVGMPISAAGIQGEQNNVLVPSLITVQLARTYGGHMVTSAPSLRYEYFSLRYSPKLWDVKESPKELSLKSIKGCRFVAGTGNIDIPQTWKEEKVERRIGGNIFLDSRFMEHDEAVRRRILLSNAGIKYGLPQSDFGEYIFQVFYDNKLSVPELISCTRSVDEVLATFNLRNASETILIENPDIPIHVNRDETLAIEGMSRSFDNSVQAVILDEEGRVLWRGSAFASSKDSRSFGKFTIETSPLHSAGRSVQLKLFHYSRSDGSPIDVIALPLAID